MFIELLKKQGRHKKGTVLNVTRDKYREMIEDKTGKEPSAKKKNKAIANDAIPKTENE